MYRPRPGSQFALVQPRSAFIPSLKPAGGSCSHFTDAPRGDGIVRLPLRCPDWRAAHCLGALGNSSGPPRIGKRPGSILDRSPRPVLRYVRPFRDPCRPTVGS